jgi:hypothetical protein
MDSNYGRFSNPVIKVDLFAGDKPLKEVAKLLNTPLGMMVSVPSGEML